MAVSAVDDPSQDPNEASPSPEPLESNPEVDEFFRKLWENNEMRRPKPSDEAIAAALQAIQRLGAGEGQASEPEIGTPPQPCSLNLIACRQCGYRSQPGNQFCGMCGNRLQAGAESPDVTPSPPVPSGAQHHYHHHYHHHYFAPGQEEQLGAAALAQRMPTTAAKEAVRLRTSLPGTGVSRGEAMIRQLTQDWALACNNKQLDDLLSFYATDALVLRPNVPPIRGTPAIREFFFSVLDSGLGDVEMETLRVELAGDIAYEAGRCKMLVPMTVGKRREERGKYVILFAKQKSGEWKAVVDSWSSDLSLTVATESSTTNTPVAGPNPKPRRGP